MTAHLMVHVPATLPAFGHWLAAHWPTAPRGCQWQYGGRGLVSSAHWSWQEICR